MKKMTLKMKYNEKELNFEREDDRHMKKMKERSNNMRKMHQHSMQNSKSTKTNINLIIKIQSSWFHKLLFFLK